jgi:hypothetical protein
MRFERCGAILALGFIIGSCAPAATDGGFDSPSSSARLYAIEKAARSGDRTAVADLVELLDSDDPAVRLMAITALQRLTGRTYGYRHYDPVQERNAAIERWVQALEADALSYVETDAANGVEHDG